MTPLTPSPANLSLPHTFSLIDVPFIVSFSSPEFDKTIIFIVAVLLSITVNAEAQAFMATVLGDIRNDARDRFHFNPLLHINLAGLICFVAAGFGWPKQVEINTEQFKHPALAVILIKFTGAFANLILAGIAGSILFVMKKWNLEDQVFSIVVSVNIMVFVYNFIPIPPLAGASLLSSIISVFSSLKRKTSQSGIYPLRGSHVNDTNIYKTSPDAPPKKYLVRLFPYMFTGVIIVMRIKGWTFLNDTLHPVVKAIFKFIAG